jgi:hypothetical protein
METDKNRFLTQFRNNYKLRTGREPTSIEEMDAYTQYLQNMNAAYDSKSSSSPSSSVKTMDYYKQRQKDVLNQVVGEKCPTCKGTGKCRTCNGTKIYSAFGHTFKCTNCPENGICTVCDGTGKTSWNR